MGVFFDCKTTYAALLPACSPTILVEMGLEQSTDYTYRITTPLGKIYEQDFQADTEGSFEIDVETYFPQNLFNPWAGTFILEVFLKDGCIPQSLEVCQAGFTAVAMRFYEANYPTTAIIGCECQ